MAKAPTPPRRDPREFWIEMSIREISTQAHFADLAFSNLDPKAMTGTDAVFSSIHSFLSHCAMVSKMLKGSEAGVPGTIGDVLGIDSESPVHKRRFRNALEHYDRELQKWIQAMPPGANIGTYNVGPKDPLGIPNMIFVSHYDPHSTVFTFVDDDFDLGVLHAEALRVKGVADEWVANHDALKRGANVPARSFSTAP
jgi:hypothetical protein